jgi:hypothetical protein
MRKLPRMTQATDARACKVGIRCTATGVHHNQRSGGTVCPRARKEGHEFRDNLVRQGTLHGA